MEQGTRYSVRCSVRIASKSDTALKLTLSSCDSKMDSNDKANNTLLEDIALSRARSFSFAVFSFIRLFWAASFSSHGSIQAPRMVQSGHSEKVPHDLLAPPPFESVVMRMSDF